MKNPVAQFFKYASKFQKKGSAKKIKCAQIRQIGVTYRQI